MIYEILKVMDLNYRVELFVIEKDSYFFSSFSLLAKAILNSFFFIPDPEFIWLITFEEKTTFLSKILEISIFKIAK